MATQIVIPEMGESVTSGTIQAWLVKDGQYVERDDTVVEIETDKITMEVPAPASGIVTHSASVGDEVDVGAVIGTIDESADKPAGGSAKASADKESAEGGSDVPSKSQPASATATQEPEQHSDVKATPLARKLAQEHNVDLSSIKGSGPSGRVREQDVMASVNDATATQPPQTNGHASQATQPAPMPQAGARNVRRERMTKLRQRIAERLVDAQQTAAMLTTFNEVDMTEVMSIRKRYKEDFQKKHDISLGFMSFFVKAAAKALAEFPAVNAYIAKGDSGPEIEYHDYADIAIAVGTDKGLVVPVLRNCESRSFAQVESGIKDLASKARDGKLTLDDMQGGTFTVSNGGIYGSMMSTPILNPPQTAILGMHAIKNRPIEDPKNPGSIVLRPMMYLAVSYDHRIIDGAEAVQFLVSIKNSLEDPSRLLLDL